MLTQIKCWLYVPMILSLFQEQTDVKLANRPSLLRSSCFSQDNFQMELPEIHKTLLSEQKSSLQAKSFDKISDVK